MHYSEWPEEQKERSRQANRKWIANNPGVRDDYYKEYEKQRPNEYRLLKAARKRSRDANVPHTINVTDFIITENCPICNIKMERSKNSGGTAISPTLDRVIPKLGYVKGNVAIICKYCNSTKGAGSAEHHRKIADYIDSFANIRNLSQTDEEALVR